MELIIIGIVIAVALCISIYTFRWTLVDYRKQKNYIEGLEYRKEFGLFDIDRYIARQDAVKKLSWKKQRNTGLQPDSFHQKLDFIDYFGEDSHLVINKGQRNE